MFNKSLAFTFIKGYNLPINVVNEKSFDYYLDLYEGEFESRTKWENLLTDIANNFDNDPEKFIKYYYDVREEVIQRISKSKAYEEFNNMDMSVFAIPNTNYAKSIYNENNVGKTYISIDISKANFSALKFVNPELVLNADTYEEMIGQFTDCQFIKESKYIRQVIFGQMNPKRHITVEKYIINNIMNAWVMTFEGYLGKIVAMTTDEFIVEVRSELKPEHILKKIYTFTKSIKALMGVDIHGELFSLGALELAVESHHTARLMVYIKNVFEGPSIHRSCLKCVPAQYFAIVYKLFYGFELTKQDLHFEYEGLDAVFNEKFYLK